MKYIKVYFKYFYNSLIFFGPWMICKGFYNDIIY
jgi:hypothetical protein